MNYNPIALKQPQRGLETAAAPRGVCVTEKPEKPLLELLRAILEPLSPGGPVSTESYAAVMAGYPPKVVKDALERLRIINPRNPFRFSPEDLHKGMIHICSADSSRVSSAVENVLTADDVKSVFTVKIMRTREYTDSLLSSILSSEHSLPPRSILALDDAAFELIPRHLFKGQSFNRTRMMRELLALSPEDRRRYDADYGVRYLLTKAIHNQVVRWESSWPNDDKDPVATPDHKVIEAVALLTRLFPVEFAEMREAYLAEQQETF